MKSHVCQYVKHLVISIGETLCSDYMTVCVQCVRVMVFSWCGDTGVHAGGGVLHCGDGEGALLTLAAGGGEGGSGVGVSLQQ